ncbi:MAG: hypothetical protein IVW52_04865 [Acidimicrobiales bacterium]|nr:hypothetical protein [Acidimicrobiales bacterium]
MPKSISYAAEKWSRKTANAGAKWKAALDSGAASRYCTGLQEFLGHSAPMACAAYGAGISAVSASDFQSAVSGKAGKYSSALGRVG